MLPLAAVLLLALAGPGRADVEERIARCAEAATREAHVACLEDALRALAGGASTDGARREHADAGTDEAAAQGPAEVHAPAERDVETERSGPGVELGAEQVAARESGADEDETRVRARVVDFRFVGYRRLMVELDNGQIWRQIDGDRESVERALRDSESFEVEMWSTRLGGYRMRILSLGRTLRVERLR